MSNPEIKKISARRLRTVEEGYAKTVNRRINVSPSSGTVPMAPSLTQFLLMMSGCVFVVLEIGAWFTLRDLVACGLILGAGIAASLGLLWFEDWRILEREKRAEEFDRVEFSQGKGHIRSYAELPGGKFLSRAKGFCV